MGVIKKLAYQNWKRLPLGAKSWIDPEDLVSEGMTFVRYTLMKEFNPKLGNRFMTLLYISLDRHYKERSIAMCRIKRTIPGPIDDEADPPAEDIRVVDAMSGEQGIIKVYSLASPRLRKYMETWFFSDEGASKVFKSSVPFMKASREFRKLAQESDLGIDQCRAFLDRKRRDDHQLELLTN